MKYLPDVNCDVLKAIKMYPSKNSVYPFDEDMKELTVQLNKICCESRNLINLLRERQGFVAQQTESKQSQVEQCLREALEAH